MKTTVKAIVTGFSNSALRMPYAFATLNCGHSGEAKLVETIYACGECKKRTTEIGRNCECGYRGYTVAMLVDPVRHPEHVITKPGDEAECERCDWYQEALTKLKALDPATLSHSRFREWCGVGQLYVYKDDPTSPTGVMLALTIDATKEAEEELVKLKRGLAPLSPTEGLGGRR